MLCAIPTCDTMSDSVNNEDRERTVRVSVRLPERLVQQIDEIGGPYRDRSSVIHEALSEWVGTYRARRLEQIAQNSEEYKRILEQIRKDLGLPDQSSDAG